MHRLRSHVPAMLSAAVAGIVSFSDLLLSAAPVRTLRRPVQTEYHGTTVIDPYRWLEQASDPAVVEWTAGQNRAARDYLDRLPTRKALEHDLAALYASVDSDYFSLKAGRHWIFALKFAPPAQQSTLVQVRSLTNLTTETTILDPNKLGSPGSMSIDFYEPSRDGKLVAVSLSANGSESGTLHVYETASGRRLPDILPRVQFPTAGGSVAWNAAGTGFFYTRYPGRDERPETDLGFYQQVYFHQLGTSAGDDRYEIGREFPRIAEIELKTSEDGQHVLAMVSNGDGGEYAHWVRTPAGQWRQVARFEDRVKQVEFGRDPIYIEWPKDDSLYLLSHRDTPRGKILKTPLAQPDLNSAVEVIPTGTNVIEKFVLSASGIYISDLNGGLSLLRFHNWYATAPAVPEAADAEGAEGEGTGNAGGEETPAAANSDVTSGANVDDSRDRRGSRRREGEPERWDEWVIPVAGVFSVQEMLCRQGDELLFRTIGYTGPYAWQVYDPATSRNRTERTELRGTAPADFQDIEAIQQLATSKDGTRIPMHIIRRKGARMDGNAPTILTGYGGFGISVKPRFDFTQRVWFDQGGIVVVANLRGGGEFGDDWHQAGNRTRKQNVFDDLIACAEFLVRSNYTSPTRLAIQGASNGGLLIGAVMTQRPELFRAAIGKAGVYDMLRVELDPNGEFNTTEFGSVKVPEQFRALHAYSPYHRIQDGRAYPATLLLTGEQDGRVNPAHSRKMAARLQMATISGRPVLLRTSSNTGHGPGTSLNERIAQLVDIYSFLFEQLGVEHSSVSRGPIVGAVSSTSALAKAKLARHGQLARLALSTSPLLTRPKFIGPQRADSNHYNLVTFPLERLAPNTQYHYAIEVDGRLDRSRRGQFRTFPEGPASFRFAFASCARTASTSDVFDVIRHNQPLFYMNIGDFHYLDLTNSQVGRFRAAYDLVLTSPPQADLYRSTAFFYMWDDHDFGGNNANRGATSQQAVRTAYQEYMPHYPLPAGGGNTPIYQSFPVGRVKFIVTDLRSERDSVTNKDDAAKSMMGAQQKEWFKQELLASNGRYPLIFWVSTVPWLGERGTNYYRIDTNMFGYLHHTALTNTPAARTNRDAGSRRGPGRGGPPRGGRGGFDDQDHWSVFSTERREIYDFVNANKIRGLAILHGDAHMLAADDGSNGDYATGGGVRIPVMCGGPLDQNPSIKGGPYSQGVYRVRPGEGCFGLISVNDHGDRIEVRYSGRNNHNEEKVSLRFEVPALSPSGDRPVAASR